MKYNIVEIFKSRQGEGFNAGREVVFIRFGQCNLRCPWCDTDYNTFSEMALEEILEEVEATGCKDILITGGEPTIQKELIELLKALKRKRCWIAVETNGVQNIDSITRSRINYVATSPKILYKNLYKKSSCLKFADEVRIVVDETPAEKIIEFCKFIKNKIFTRNYFLSPCEVMGEFNMGKTLEILGELNKMEEYNKWKLSIQAHKLANIR